MSANAPCLQQGFRLQWEEVQQAYVLLYPEGMVRLNDGAAQILKRCDGLRSPAQIIGELEALFVDRPIAADVKAFIEHATTRGWLG